MNEEHFEIDQNEFDEIMNHYNAYLIEEAEEDNRINGRIFNVLKKIKSRDWIEQFKEEVKESCVYGSWEFTSKPKGKLVDESDYELVVYVNQTTNGGYTGDQFAGEIYVQIKKNKYLKMYYSM